MATVTQQHIDLSTPMGANLVFNGGAVTGATFRVWAPVAKAIYLNGQLGGANAWVKDAAPALALQRIGGGPWWGGFCPEARAEDEYKFYVVGNGSSGFKRDPYARERLGNGNGVIKSSGDFAWHDQGFRPPGFSDRIVYQLHVGSFFRHSGSGDGSFLDVVEKIPYIAALGANVVQLLPVNEFETDNSQGYNGSDYFAPEFRYAADPQKPVDYLPIVNGLLHDRGQGPVTAAQIASPYHQLKLLVDLLHLYGLAVDFDVVYNHAGGFTGDDETLYFWDRDSNGDGNKSLYFTQQSIGPGGLPFALWKGEVRQFLIDHSRYLATEFHADGFRYDEISLLIQTNFGTGPEFCRAITGTNRFLSPQIFHNAEHWPVDPNVVTGADRGGLGFDATQNDGLREAIRGAVSQAAGGAGARIDFDRLAANLYVPGFPAKWKAVQCAENHDIVFQNKGPRIPRLADPSNPRTWYGQSRSRFALGLLMTAPGIPQIFMGQEFLEDKQWSDDPNAPLHIYWEGLASGQKPMVDFLRFTQDLTWLRRNQPALRSESINVFYTHNDQRVIAFHRWLEGYGRDVVVVATLSESTYYNYRIGFPGGGRWAEAFNSDIYTNWVNPIAAGNGGQVFADPIPQHGFGYSASITIPANGFVIFTR